MHSIQNMQKYAKTIWFYLNENKPNRGQPLNLDLRKKHANAYKS